MEITELFYPNTEADVGAYGFREGIAIEVHSVKNSHFDWAKLRFTGQYQPEIRVSKGDGAAIRMGYADVLDEVFTGYVAQEYNSGAAANEILLKDEMLRLEQTIINETFQNATPQEVIRYILSQAGINRMKLAESTSIRLRRVSIPRQNAVQAIQTVNGNWGIRVPFFFSGGTFYWGLSPEQEKIYTFEQGVNILKLSRVNGQWELETVSAPFVKHSHTIRVIHSEVSGDYEVQRVSMVTNEGGFIRTFIYF